MKKIYLRSLCLLLSYLITVSAGAAPTSKDISTTIINGANNHVPVDIRSFSTGVPVSFSNRPPIPFEFIQFPRQYCSKWLTRAVIVETEERNLVEYKIFLSPIIFDREVYWQGNIYGNLFGTESHVAIGQGWEVRIFTQCDNSTQYHSTFFIPNLIPGTNQYEIDKDVNDFACPSTYQVNIQVIARIIEFNNRPITESVATNEESEGTVCFNLDTITPR